MTDIFLNIFNDYYPFERYIFIAPLEYPKTMHVSEIYVKEIPDGDFNPEDVLITLKSSDGEIEFSYFGLSNDLQGKISDGFRLDLGYREFEMLYSERECEKELGKKLTQQYKLIMQKYGECHIKENCNKLYKLVGQEVYVL
jgi:hypothetical protein